MLSLAVGRSPSLRAAPFPAASTAIVSMFPPVPMKRWSFLRLKKSRIGKRDERSVCWITLNTRSGGPAGTRSRRRTPPMSCDSTTMISPCPTSAISLEPPPTSRIMDRPRSSDILLRTPSATRRASSVPSIRARWIPVSPCTRSRKAARFLASRVALVATARCTTTPCCSILRRKSRNASSAASIVVGSMRCVWNTDSPRRTGIRTRSITLYRVGDVNSAMASRRAFVPISIPAQRTGKEVFVGDGIGGILAPADLRVKKGT